MSQFVDQTDIERLIDDADVETHIFFNGKVTVSCFRLESGFVITGTASVQSLDRYDEQTGLSMARRDAIRQLWQLETYRGSHDQDQASSQ